MLDLKRTSNTPLEESRQGEVLDIEVKDIQASKNLYIESYGCQMNFSDSEIVASILADNGYKTVNEFSEADAIFINTCAIRENAEQRVRNRLKEFGAVKREKP